MKILLLVVALLVLAGVILAASAKLDTPSQSSTVNLVIEAPRETVWAALADLDSYADWNPYITEASGDLEEGKEIRLVVRPPDEDAEDATMKVLTSRFERKLRLEDRLVLPGVRDEELTFRVIKMTPSRVRLEETARLEGILAPFADLGPTTSGLEAMAAALAQRVEGAAP
jgi:uncharacterized protein YndB with AHSA1/START domain